MSPRIPGSLEPFRKYKGGGNSLRGSADTAALFVTHLKGVCGIGYRLSYDAGNNYDESTLSMSRVDCAMAGYTFGHELSHNFGNWHDKYQNGWREYAYAQGFHIPGSKFRTIMAYRRSQKPKNTLQIEANWQKWKSRCSQEDHRGQVRNRSNWR